MPGSPPVQITRETLQQWPLPQPDEQGDKDSRGSVLIVAGSLEMPGAAVLAATAALRSGVGRLRIATCDSIATAVGVAVPEARIFRLPETRAGGVDPGAAGQLTSLAERAQAVLIGPGMIDEVALKALVERLLPQIEQAVVILDAGALTAGATALEARAAHNRKTILTPHAGEMARLCTIDKGALAADPQGVVCRAAGDFAAVVVLKGPTTWIAGPDEQLYHYQEGHVGLASSGSGDTLAGMIAGLAARRIPPIQAAAWGVYLHGEAGNRLARQQGPVGFLARELPDAIAPIMLEL